jgi:Ca2+-transporting ATPase
MIASLCNNSSIRIDEETGQLKPIGDPTEVALTVAAEKGGLGRDYWKKQGYTKVFERAFDSERKLMSSLFTRPNQDSMMVCKGAPEELLLKCSHCYNPNGRDIQEMTDDFASSVYDESIRMASQGLRVLGLGYKKVGPNVSLNSEKSDESDEPESSSSALAETGFTFVGLVGLIDPPKQGVKEAVATCQQAGIRVIMITGDHIRTATAIATQLGIFKENVPGMVSCIRTYLKKHVSFSPLFIFIHLRAALF